MLAANLSGPRRIKAGAARDHFLGLTAVSGRGETFKSGGRVVKNVTGYDLCKLMAGSWGTLAALTEVTIKTLPRPETEATVAIVGLDDAAAVKAMTAAMGSSCDVSGAAHLPAPVAGASRLPKRQRGGRALTLLRLEGVAPSVAHRQAALIEIVKPFGEVGADRRGVVVAAVARDPRRAAVRGQPDRRRSAALARLDRADARCRAGAAWSPPGPAPPASTIGPAGSSGCRSTAPATTPAHPSCAARWRPAAATPR